VCPGHPVAGEESREAQSTLAGCALPMKMCCHAGDVAAGSSGRAVILCVCCAATSEVLWATFFYYFFKARPLVSAWLEERKEERKENYACLAN